MKIINWKPLTAVLTARSCNRHNHKTLRVTAKEISTKQS